MTTPLCLPKKDWPEADRDLWRAAQIPPSFLEGCRPASAWSDSQKRIAEQGYGQWLSFLIRHGCADWATPPGEGVSQELVHAFIADLQERPVAEQSLAIYLRGMLALLEVIETKTDWGWLRDLYREAKASSRPAKHKLPHIVSHSELYELGLELMETEAELSRPNRYYHATKFRDGLMIAMLICCPVRIGNFYPIEIGIHLKYDDGVYWLDIPEAETKTRHAYQGEYPEELTPYIEKYLEVHRPLLQSTCPSLKSSRRLWLSYRGTEMAEDSVRDQLCRRTTRAFGRHVWPHLFRHCAATGLVDSTPEGAKDVPEILGHTNETTGDKYYIQSLGLQAQRRTVGALGRLRTQAREEG